MKSTQLQRLFLSILLAFTFISAAAQESNVRDGNWWRQQSQPTKYSFMIGFYEGMDLGADFSVWKYFHDDSKSDVLRLASESYNEYVKNFLRRVSNVQLADGLDSFYSDYRNRTIGIKGAVWLVLNEIAGTPKEELQQMTESWRRNSTR